MGRHHPECPERLTAIDDRLIAAGLAPLLAHYSAPAAAPEQLRRVHEAGYIDAIYQAAPQHGYASLDPDTAMNPHSLVAALHAAGAAVLATDLVVTGEVENAFCSVRPPGHHATRNRAMGFCLFNNVAVGAAHALEQHGLARVAILDFDVHHGNGTEDIFRDDPRVMLCSTFQHPFYPFSGADCSVGHIVNVPLPAGTGGAAFRQAVMEHWVPAMERFKPEMLFISAGFDAHREDEMAFLNLVEADYVWVTRLIKSFASQYAGGRVVSTLEGGYCLDALGRSATEHIRVLAGL